MHDLTQGSIPKHLVRLAAPMAMGMIFQTLYYFVDLYFVAKLGSTAVAGVSAGGNLTFIILAVTQVITIGTMVLIAHAVGRKDQDDANLIFNQSLFIAAACAVATLVLGYSIAPAYLAGISADAATAAAARSYMFAYLPGMALQFGIASMGAALRGTGIAKPTMIVQMSTVLLNALLAPILIAGWGTGKPLGVAGAGLATTIAVVAGTVFLFLYFRTQEKYVAFHPALAKPRTDALKRILRIGLPAGGEFGVMFVFLGMIYWLIAPFGAEAQAGYGVGSRVMQGIFLPAMAIAFATAPIAGQNHAAGHPERVRATFYSALKLGSMAMLLLTLICQWKPEVLVHPFSSDARVVEVGAGFLGIISLNFIASGIIFTCSSMFQAFGNTVPSLISSSSRLITFGIPAIYLSRQPGFTLKQVWYLSVATTTLQMFFSLWLVRRNTPDVAAVRTQPAS